MNYCDQVGGVSVGGLQQGRKYSNCKDGACLSDILCGKRFESEENIFFCRCKYKRQQTMRWKDLGSNTNPTWKVKVMKGVFNMENTEGFTGLIERRG